MKDFPDAKLRDGFHVILLNASYTIPNAEPEILELLTFIKENDMNHPFKTQFVHTIMQAVDEVRHVDAPHG